MFVFFFERPGDRGDAIYRTRVVEDRGKGDRFFIPADITVTVMSAGMSLMMPLFTDMKTKNAIYRTRVVSKILSQRGQVPRRVYGRNKTEGGIKNF